jgi:hypothetical protein
VRAECLFRCNSQRGLGGALLPLRMHGPMLFRAGQRQHHAVASAAELWRHRCHGKRRRFLGLFFFLRSRAAAEQEALTRCEAKAGRKGACEAVWFYNSCGAFAIGSDGAWAADHADTTAQASASALRSAGRMTTLARATS